MLVEQFATFFIPESYQVRMSAGGPNSVDISRQSARYLVALGLVLLSVTVAGAALGGVTAAESQSSPIEISDWTDLDDIRNDLDADYVLVNDLNETTPGYDTVAGPNANGGKGFDPIGFSGNFDGQGNSIEDLIIDRPNEDGVGLFWYTSGGAVIEEVILTGATVTGSSGVGGLVGDNVGGTVSTSSASGAVTGSEKVGGLVGANYAGGTVSTSSASGAVTGSEEVGGLVGDNFEGTVSNSSASSAVTGSEEVGGLAGDNFEGTVSNSSASGTVNGSDKVGGLVGYNEGGGTVSTSSASGAVTGSDKVGGLVGENFASGTVSTSSASGVVNGSEEVGGLVGSNFDGGTVSNSSASATVIGSGDFPYVGGLVGGNFGTVSNSSASGAVNGTSEFGFVGGLVGDNEGTVSDSLASGVVNGTEFGPGGGLVGYNNGTVTGAYWDTQATGQSQSAGGIGLNTSQMQGASAAQNMGALDFTNTWEVMTNPPGYPELRSLPDGPGPEPPLTAGFTITPEDPIVGEQLTFDAAPSTPESDIKSYNWTLGDGTTATGKQVTHTYTDSGQFTVKLTVQGGAETDSTTEIVNVSAPSSSVEISDWSDLDDIRNDTDADYVLVNNLNETTPGDTVAGPNANGGKGFDPIGGFNGSFDGQGNSIANLTIDRPSENEVGLFRDTSGSAVIEEVILTGATVTGSDDVGGVIGKSNGPVSNSSASGNVTGSENVGGLVGYNSGTVSNSSASGVVTGSSTVGGLVGDNDFGGTVSNSEASGDVTTTGYFVGGLVGSNDGTVSTSSASGAVNGSSRLGGLVGYNFARVSNSEASGAVTGSYDVGGLVGVNSGGVSNSEASGAVTGSGDGSDVGGLVGDNGFSGTVSNSSASGAVTGSVDVGGLVGENEDGTVSESFATGAVTGSTRAGGLVGLLGSTSLDTGDEAILRDSYYDTQTTEQQAAVGKIREGDGTAELRGEVAGLPTSQMQGTIAAQNMDTLDFTTTWRVVTNPPGYPELRSLPDGPGPEPPLTAGFTITPENPTAGEQLTLDASPSTPESAIESYDWTLGDGTTATGEQVTHTYTDSGQFTVELTVQDGTETDTATKTVSDPRIPSTSRASLRTSAGQQSRSTLTSRTSTPASPIASESHSRRERHLRTRQYDIHRYRRLRWLAVPGPDSAAHERRDTPRYRLRDRRNVRYRLDIRARHRDPSVVRPARPNQ